MELNQQFLNGADQQPRSLKGLLHVIVSNALPEAIRHNTHIINEVKQEIKLASSIQCAARIMNELLMTIVSNSMNGDIHINVDQYADVVTLKIEERNNYNGYALAFSIDSLAPQAIALGGHISIKGRQQKITTISFSFPYNYAA